MQNRSRLSRRLEQQSKKNLFFSVIGIIVVLFLLIQYGIPFIANMSLLISGNDTETVEQKKVSEFISSPSLDIPFSATNSATITVSGSANKDVSVKLYVNDGVFETTKPDDDNMFTFEDVKLEEGENRIQAKAVNNKKEESDFSDEVIVIYKKKEPTLTIDSPSNGQNFAKEEQYAKVSGKTDAGTKVTVNDFWAIVDSEGKFSYNLPLRDGEITIKITATDTAGNKKEEERKITRQ